MRDGIFVKRDDGGGDPVVMVTVVVFMMMIVAKRWNNDNDPLLHNFLNITLTMFFHLSVSGLSIALPVVIRILGMYIRAVGFTYRRKPSRCVRISCVCFVDGLMVEGRLYS